MIDFWQCSTIHNYACKVIEEQTLWGQTVCRVRLPSRDEALRTSFKKIERERDYATIVAGADKTPNNVLEEDPKLFKWYDQAVTRMGVA